ncbi:MAG: hypothetical protein ACUVTR_07425, partial [Dehalococcoidia bacterium]
MTNNKHQRTQPRPAFLQNHFHDLSLTPPQIGDAPAFITASLQLLLENSRTGEFSTALSYPEIERSFLGS